MKKTSTTERKDLAKDVTERIISALEQGAGEWMRPWKGSAAIGLPSNFSTGRAYRGLNVLLLWATAMSKGYKDTRWLTFKQALDLKGHVRKGEKGVQLVYWKRLGQKSEGEEGEEVVEGKQKVRLVPLSFTVFNVEQCDKLTVEPLPAPPTVSEDDVLSLALKLGARVQHGGDRAFYSPAADFVQMPFAADFVDRGAYRSTLLHEVAHWTGHTSRLNRNLSGRFGSESYAAEELVAEMASAFMCAAIGVEGKLQHPEYVANWLQVLKNDKYAVFTAARHAQQVMELVLGKAEEEEQVAAAA